MNKLFVVCYVFFIICEGDFVQWYQEVIVEVEMVEELGVCGCMVIWFWGYGIWECIQKLMDEWIKVVGVDNCYFLLFILFFYFVKEVEYVEGFVKEMVVVIYYWLIGDGKGGFVFDFEVKLEELLIVCLILEMVIGVVMVCWVQFWCDLLLFINQWVNVVCWEMCMCMFLCISEFFWQEGYIVYVDCDDVMVEILCVFEMYCSFVGDVFVVLVIVGEKFENECFFGVVVIYSIEVMMQDGKVLQVGILYYFGIGFVEVVGICYQDREGQQLLCYIISWGVFMCLIGGVIMIYGDDDGLCVLFVIVLY